MQLWATTTGGGHRRVAEAVRTALWKEAGPSLRVAIDDPLTAGARLHARALLGSYGPLVRSAPAAWGVLFRAFAPAPPRRVLEAFLLTGLGGAMDQLTAERRPRVVVNCHPLLGPGAFRAAGRLSPAVPLVTMITDLTVVHPGWLSVPATRFLTASSVATRWCWEQGVDRQRVVEVGLPIDPSLSPPDREPRPLVRRRLGLVPDRLCVLVGGGGEGAGHLRPSIHALARSQLPLQLVVLCGRNRALLGWLNRRQWPLPIRALPYTADPSPWLLGADVYVGKAGPSALAEAASANLAILVTGALPGQERANRDLVVASSAALSVADPAALVAAMARLTTPGDPLLASLRAGAARWARPQAAELAAAEILSLI